MANKTPADKDVLDKILNPSKKKAPPGYMTKLNEAEKLTESFIKSIADAGRKMQSNDCSDRAKDWIDGLTGNTLTTITNYIDKLNKSSTAGGGLHLIGNIMHAVAPKWEDMICLVVPQTANLIIEVIEAVLVLANKLFKKIDNYRKKLEKAITFFIQEARTCIMNIIKGLAKALDGTIDNISEVSVLAKLIDDCPCLKEIILGMIPHKWKEECKNTSTGADFLDCLKKQTGTVNLLTGINQWVQENIIDKFIIKAFDALYDAVYKILEYVMKPFRWAIKAYCRLLNKPLPAPFIGNPLSPCLFVHNEENGKYRMSVMQYLQTAKVWAGCFDGICGSLSDDLKLKIKENNENLRLNIKYWLGGQELDIYSACIAPTNEVPDSQLKAIWTKVHIDPFKEMLDFIKDSRDSLTREERQPKDSKDEVELDPLQDAITITNGSDNEMFPITKGYLKFYSALTEKSIVKIIQNIGGVINYHNYYERLNELLQWEQPFIKSQNHLDTIISVRNRLGAETDDFEAEPLNDFYSVLPTYRINDDYNILTAINKPEQLSNESRVDYYTRWYSNTIVASS